MNMNTTGSPWFPAAPTQGERPARLFCLPFAGGSAAAFAPWRALADPGIEIVPVQLPGRGARIREPLLEDPGEMADALAGAMVSRLDRPFGVFGHSMGALLAFEMLRRLREMAAPAPVALFVSARRAPHLPPRRPPLHLLPDQDLIGELRALNGTPELVLRDRELLGLLLPVIRADLKAAETYQFRAGEPFDFPIHAFGGTRDRIASEDLEAWSQHTTSDFGLTLYDGDHFFLDKHRKALVLAIGAIFGRCQDGR